jgi:hypothetical protein
VPSRADDRRDRRLGDRVTTTPSTRIGTVLNSALSWLDPRGQAARARRARTHEVGVTQRTLADGLGQITVIDKLEVTRALIERIDDDADEVLAHSAACGPCADVVPAEIGPARAAALRGIFFARPHDQDRRRLADPRAPCRRHDALAHA